MFKETVQAALIPCPSCKEARGPSRDQNQAQYGFLRKAPMAICPRRAPLAEPRPAVWPGHPASRGRAAHGTHILRFSAYTRQMPVLPWGRAVLLKQQRGQRGEDRERGAGGIWHLKLLQCPTSNIRALPILKCHILEHSIGLVFWSGL